MHIPNHGLEGTLSKPEELNVPGGTRRNLEVSFFSFHMVFGVINRWGIVYLYYFLCILIGLFNFFDGKRRRTDHVHLESKNNTYQPRDNALAQKLLEIVNEKFTYICGPQDLCALGTGSQLARNDSIHLVQGRGTQFDRPS